MSDPTVAWGFENTGSIGWSGLAPSDSEGVLAKAAEFGLKHGATCATGSDESRSIGSFARSDRNFTEDERAMFMEKLKMLHAATENMRALSPETAAALRTMSVQFTHT